MKVITWLRPSHDLRTTKFLRVIGGKISDFCSSLMLAIAAVSNSDLVIVFVFISYIYIIVVVSYYLCKEYFLTSYNSSLVNSLSGLLYSNFELKISREVQMWAVLITVLLISNS